MKKLILSIVCCFFVATTFAQLDSLSGQSFGEGVKPGEIKPVSAIETTMGDQDITEMKVTGKVIEVCKKKGCWMTLKMPDGEPIRITFKDYAFFMPKDIAGKTVVLVGIAKKQTISVETLRHYAEDAHQSADEVAKITDPKKEIAFEAKGVVILDK